MSDASQDAPAAESSINSSRRYFLIGATSVAAGLGVVGAAVPFISYWKPSAKARAAGAPVTVDISKLIVGEMLTVAWRGKPIFIIKRDEPTVAALESSDLDLADPDSDQPQQPEYAKNGTRSMRPDIGLYLGICTHLGCSPKLVEADNFDDGSGGFFCPCHGSKFDLAGRVGAGFPAPTNLEVPPYRFDSDTVITIGLEGAA
ncbi:MAG: ubiquinol-cytochrome c reductase iron-sulfur subunit [Pseudomonadota bacterium]